MEAIIKKSQKQKSKKKKNIEKTFKPLDPSFCEFKKAEKKYKIYNDYLTDFSELLDFSKPIDLSSLPIERKNLNGFQVYKFLEPEGIYLIKKFLTIPEQLLITIKCLNEYSKKPYRTNLFIYENDNQNNINVEKEEVKSIYSTEHTYNKERYYVKDFSRYCFDRKIRWSNVGYQYDWNNRTYPEEKTTLPIDLLKLSEKTKEFIKGELPEVLDYQAESTIINYYDAKNFMGGHLDDGEKNQKSPIFSYSFGLSCVFLIGGKTKDIKPWAIKLDSGSFY